MFPQVDIDAFGPFYPELMRGDRNADHSSQMLQTYASVEAKGVSPVLDQIRNLARDSVFVQMWADFQELAYLGGGALDLQGLHKRLRVRDADLDELLHTEISAYRKAVERVAKKVRAEGPVFGDDHIHTLEADDELFAGLL